MFNAIFLFISLAASPFLAMVIMKKRKNRVALIIIWKKDVRSF